MSQKRVIIRAELTPSAKTTLQKVCDERGMTQVSVMSRLVQWFAHQDQLVQVSVLGLVSEETTRKLGKELIERLALTRRDAPETKGGK